MLHHLRHAAHAAHHHAQRAGRGLLVKAAEHHPILTSVLAIVGGVAVVKKLTDKPAPSAPSGGPIT